MGGTQQILDHTPGLTANDAPNINTRVFKLKLDKSVHLIKKLTFFGQCIGGMHMLYKHKRAHYLLTI